MRTLSQLNVFDKLTVLETSIVCIHDYCVQERCPVRRFLWAAAFTLVLALPSSAQTAHDYFKELKAANTFDHYKDEYVCFRDDDTPSFAIVAKVSDVIEHMKQNGDTSGIKNLQAAKTALIVETFYKGVSSGTNIFDLAKREDSSEDSKDYSYEFAGKNPGKMLYSINWATGRYLLRVYMYQKSRTIASAEGSGKCELIHPAQPWI